MDLAPLLRRLLAIRAPAVATLLGLAAFLACFDPRILAVQDLGWVSRGDIATNFLGWHFFRHEAWNWPPGLLANYAQGLGASIALTDSIALVAFALKPFQALLPPIFNYLGLWIALCFALQGYFGYRVLRCLGVSAARAAAGALLLCVLPFMISRATLHVPLASHWLLLAALQVYLDAIREPRRFRRWSLLLPVSILVNAYLFTAIAAVFLASAAALLWKAEASARRSILLQSAAAGGLAIAALYFVGFFFVDVTPTWGAYGQLQMNLLSWFNSQGLGTLLPSIPLAEAGQTEAFLYLGAGGIATLVVGGWQLARARVRIGRPYVPLALVAVALLALAVSHRVAFGSYFLFELPLPYFLQEKLNAFRASGRLAWLPTYLLMVVAIAGCARLRPRAFTALMVMAIGLNLVDARPIRAIGWSLVANAGHRGPPSCHALPASVERVVFLPRITLDDHSIGEAFDLALCAAEQHQPINVGYLARVNLVRAEAASREAASWLDRAPARNVAFAYRNPATGRALGAGADAPTLGGFRVFVPNAASRAAALEASSHPDPVWAWPLEIDMGVQGRGGDVQLAGWAAPMEGMVWSYAGSASLLLPVPEAIAADARVSLYARPAPTGRDLTLSLKANGVSLPPLTLSGSRGLTWHPVTVPAAVLAEARGILRLELTLPADAPFDPPRGYPEDRMRLLVSRLHVAVPRPDIDAARVSASNPGAAVLGAGWSIPEEWGTWSIARTATLRLRMPAERDGGLRLRALAHAYGPGGRQSVRVVVAGRELARWSYVSLGADEWREAEIPGALLPAEGDELLVELEIDAPSRPAIPGSTDRRTLGIGLVEYQLSRR